MKINEMDHQELAEAIRATHSMLKNTLEKTPVYEDIEKHLKYLFGIQAARAGAFEQYDPEKENT